MNTVAMTMKMLMFHTCFIHSSFIQFIIQKFDDEKKTDGLEKRERASEAARARMFRAIIQIFGEHFAETCSHWKMSRQYIDRYGVVVVH